MNTLKLFKTDDIAPIFKTASMSVQLANPPEDWDQEILDNVLKLHPWLVDFMTEVEFVKRLPDRQFGLGAIVVRPRKPLDPNSTQATAFLGSKQEENPVLAHIPIVIREGEMSPLDLFVVNGDVYPLDEETFRNKIGGATDTSTTTSSRSDPTLIGHLWPPGRSSFGGPGAELGLSVLNKFSSSEEPNHDFYFMSALKKYAEDQIASLTENEGFPLIQQMIEGSLRADLKKAAQLQEMVEASSGLRPLLGEVVGSTVASLPPSLPQRGSVVQILKTADGYAMRTTDPRAFSFGTPAEVQITQKPDTFIFTSVAPQAQTVLTEKTAADYSWDDADLGVAYVRDGHRERKGVVFTNIVDFNGEKTAQMLFTDFHRHNWSMEDSLPAQQVAKLASVDTDPLEGTGVFVFGTADGLSCSTPVTIHRQDEGVGGPVFRATLHSTKLAGDIPIDLDVKLTLSEAIAKPAFVAKSASLLLPAKVAFMKIGENRFRPYAPITYQKDVVEITKLAGDEYLLSGGPVRNVVSDALNTEDTQLVLASLGVPVEAIDGVLKAAEGGTSISDCIVLQAREDPAVQLPHKVDTELLKAAAALDDPSTVDSVLGLNMMDHEAEDNYMTMSQNLEQTQQKVAKLLLMSRLGMYSIPEGPAKIVMLRLTPIIDALKVLALQTAYAR